MPSTSCGPTDTSGSPRRTRAPTPSRPTSTRGACNSANLCVVKTAADLGIPERFNATAHFVVRHLAEGRDANVAIECGDERVTYAELAERVNRCGSALRDVFGVEPGDRVVLLLHDGPAFFYAFYGAIKIGAVPVPINTLWKTPDYRFVLRDSGAVALVVS